MEAAPYLITTHGLTDEQFALIGKTVMNWSVFEACLGAALGRLYGLNSKEASTELVHAIDMRKKIDLLRKISKRPPHEGSQLPFKEVIECYNLWSDDRNMLAHGFFISRRGAAPFLSSSKRLSDDMGHDLERMHLRSIHIGDAMTRLLFALDGQELYAGRPSPQRPE